MSALNYKTTVKTSLTPDPWIQRQRFGDRRMRWHRYHKWRINLLPPQIFYSYTKNTTFTQAQTAWLLKLTRRTFGS